MLKRVGAVVVALVSVLTLAAVPAVGESPAGSCVARAEAGAGMYELRPVSGGFDMVRVAGLNPGSCVGEPVNSLSASVTWRASMRGEPDRWSFRYGERGESTVGFFESPAGWFFVGGEVVWQAETLR